MTNLEGRVLLRRAGGRAARRACAATWRCSPGWPSGSARRCAFAHRAARRSSTSSRRASAGGPADYAGITYDRIRRRARASSGPARPTDHPGTPRLFLDRFATPDGRARFVAVEHAGAAEQPCDDYPVHLTTGRVLAQYQSGAQTRRIRDARRRRARSSSCTRCSPSRLGVATGDRSRSHPARRVTAPGPGRSPTIRPDTVFVPFHWVGRQPADQRRARPVQPDAGVQGLRRAVRVMTPRTAADARASSSSATGWPPPGSSRSSVARGTHGHVTVLGAEPHAAVQPDPAVRRARGHARAERLTLRDPPRGTPTGVDCASARGSSRSTGSAASVMLVDGEAHRLRPAGAGHRQHPDAAADPRAGPDGRPAAPEGARVPHASTTAGASSRRRCPARRSARRGRRRAARPRRWPGRWPCAGSPPRSSRAPSTCWRARSTPRPARSSPATSPARHRGLHRRPARSGSTEQGLVLDNGVTLDDRPRRARLRRPAVDRAGPPRRAGRAPRRRRRRPAALVDDPLDPRRSATAPSTRRDHRLRRARLGAGRRWSPTTCRAATSRYTGTPQRRPAARHRTSTSPCSATPERTEGEVVELTNPRRGTYRKLVVRDGVIVGATLVGDLVPRSACSPSTSTAAPSSGRREPGELLLGRAARAAAGPAARRRRGLRLRRRQRRPDPRLQPTSTRSATTTRATTGCGGCAPAVRQPARHAAPSARALQLNTTNAAQPVLPLSSGGPPAHLARPWSSSATAWSATASCRPPSSAASPRPTTSWSSGRSRARPTTGSR